MSIFEDVVLKWKGEEFTVKAGEMMRMIAKVEAEITIRELTKAEGPPLSKLAMGYAVALTHAGAKATHEQVYESLFMASQDEGNVIVDAVSILLMMMMPPSTYQPQGTAKAGKPKAKRKPKAK